MGDENYPPLRIPALPGMHVEKDSSDSDPEAVAARKERKKLRMQKDAEEERQKEQEQEKRRRREEELADKDQIFHIMCSEQRSAEVLEFLSSIECTRPEGFEERIEVAGSLREKAKDVFSKSDVDDAVRHWLGAVHCLDFTPRQLKDQPKKERVRVFEALAPTLSNLSMAYRKKGDANSAIQAAAIGLEVARKTDYQKSKELRIKLRLHLALAYGEKRDFESALQEANHVLDLVPDHEEASAIARNCEVALRREKGPEEQRWKGALTTPLQRKSQKNVNNQWGIAVVCCKRRPTKQAKGD